MDPTRRLRIATLLTLAACYDPDPPPEQCLDFVVDDALLDGVARLGEDVTLSWHNRVVRVGGTTATVPAVDESIHITGAPIRVAPTTRPAGVPPATVPGEPRSILASALLGNTDAYLPVGEYTVEVFLADHDGVPDQCSPDGHGYEMGTLTVEPCACEAVYSDVDLLVDNLALAPLSPAPGEDFAIEWTVAITAQACVPPEAVPQVRFREIVRLTPVGGGGRTLGLPPVERTVEPLAYGDSLPRSVQISDFTGQLPSPGTYAISVELDTAGATIDCATPDDDPDLTNNTVTATITVPGRRR